MGKDNRIGLFALPELIEDARNDVKRFLSSIEEGLRVFKGTAEMMNDAVKSVEALTKEMREGQKVMGEFIEEMRRTRVIAEDAIRTMRMIDAKVDDLRGDFERMCGLIARRGDERGE